MKLLDTVALVEDIPALKLCQGQVGTIVEEYEPDVFVVEFSGFKGRTYTLETLRALQLMVLQYELLKKKKACLAKPKSFPKFTQKSHPSTVKRHCQRNQHPDRERPLQHR